MPDTPLKAQPPAWLVWVLVLGAAGLTLHACWRADGRPRHLVKQAATRLQKVPPPAGYKAVDDGVLGASQGRHLYLRMRWSAEEHEIMHHLGTMHWVRGSYILYPRRVWVAPLDERADPLNLLPVNAPLPTAYWFSQAQVAGILELTYDQGLPRRQRLPIPAPGAAPEAAP